MNSTARNHRNFWLLNAAGWAVYLSISGVFFAAMSGQMNRNTALIQALAFALLVPVTGALRALIKARGWVNTLGRPGVILGLLGLTLLLSLAVQFSVSLFMMYGLGMMNWSTYSVPVLAMTVAQTWFMLVAWLLLYFAIIHRRNAHRQALEKWQAESALKAAELHALKAQLDPHFIFNCLNNLRALVTEDVDRTRQMITHLSEILKYTLHHNRREKVTLGEEMDHVANYLALQSLHLEARLQTAVQVPQALRSAQVPPLSVQLLVENAIKHGIMHRPGGGEVSIAASAAHGQLSVQVRNPGDLQKHTAGHGIGLNNLRERLALLWPHNAALHLREERGAVVADLRLPLETEGEPRHE